MRGSNGVSLPRHASTVSAPATNAAASARSAANSPDSRSAVDTCVPLSRASPSFGASSTGVRPAAASAAAPGSTRLPTRASPSPISTDARCASGARSPDAPTEPCAGMHGTMPALATPTTSSTTSHRTPEYPRASDAAFSAITRRTVASSSSGPVPALCERTSARCNSASRASSIRVRASSPKPVLTP